MVDVSLSNPQFRNTFVLVIIYWMRNLLNMDHKLKLHDKCFNVIRMNEGRDANTAYGNVAITDYDG